MVLGPLPHPTFSFLFRLLPGFPNASGFVVGPAAESVVEVAGVLLGEEAFENVVVTLSLAAVAIDRFTASLTRICSSATPIVR